MPSMVELYVIFTIGLVSSLHCVQMCGPIVLSFSLPLAGHSARTRWMAQLAYNVGRLVTYSVLGSVAGMAGASIARISGFESAATLTAGALMIAAGLVLAGLFKSSPLIAIGAPAPFSRRIARLLLSPAAGTKFRMGLLLGFLPCGLIYAALLRSVATQTAAGGAATMLAFGLGTAGPLLILGGFSAALTQWLGRWSTQLAAVSVLLMGASLIWRGLMPASLHHH